MRNKKTEIKIYECLGVNIFRKYILFTWEKVAKFLHIKVGYRIKDMSIEGLKDYKIQSKLFALTHFCLLIYIIILAIIKDAPVVTWVVNIIINSYCIMVQRYNHIRINRLIDIKQRREKKKQELGEYVSEQNENSKTIEQRIVKNDLSTSNISNLDNINLRIKECQELIEQLTIKNEEKQVDFKVLKKTIVKK